MENMELCSGLGKNQKVNAENFTDEELYIISDGMLNLIRDTNRALKMVYDEKSINALKEALERYQEINRKVCMMLK